TAHSTQHTAHSTQHTAHSTQHTAHSTHFEQFPKLTVQYNYHQSLSILFHFFNHRAFSQILSFISPNLENKRYISRTILALLGLVISNNALSALTAATVKEIHGSAPYLTFDNGVTHANSIVPLLSITLPGNRVVNASKDTSSMENPIMLDKVSATFADIKTLVSFKNYPNELTDNVIENNGYWKDDDGDIIHGNGMSKLKIKWENIEGQDITDYVKHNANSLLNGCDAPYKLTLEVGDMSIETEYGIPSQGGHFTGGKHTYFLYPKVDKPKFCYAKPNLEFDFHSGKIPYDGAISSINAGNGEWNKHRGFYAYNPANPGANFPTTGSHNLFFYLSVAGMKAQEFINTNGDTISKGGVTLKLHRENSSPTGLVKITLTGPSLENPGAFTPSTFYWRDANNQPLYSFKLERWYVAKKGGGAGGYQNAVAFCNHFNGGGYRIIKVLDFTNGRASKVNWQIGIVEPFYLRKISYKANGYWMGGLLSEWGRMTQLYYKDSDWEYFRVGDPVWGDSRAAYWTSDDQNHWNYNYVVEANTGGIGDRAHSDQDYRVACVTP
ncbi:hypothetical protein, partial [Gilliamella sp. App6-5]|uniref:hypothetical protein n=1 Tax=Gilliamella sp. App6-5 TaxID=3120232 RepID=UPI00159EEB4D